METLNLLKILEALGSLLASLIGFLCGCALTAYINSKIVNTKFDALKEHTDEQFGNIEQKIDKLDAEVQRIRTRLHDWASHIGWIDQQRRNYSRYEGEERRLLPRKE